jgi:hypothetical protein
VVESNQTNQAIDFLSGRRMTKTSFQHHLKLVGSMCIKRHQYECTPSQLRKWSISSGDLEQGMMFSIFIPKKPNLLGSLHAQTHSRIQVRVPAPCRPSAAGLPPLLRAQVDDLWYRHLGQQKQRMPIAPRCGTALLLRRRAHVRTGHCHGSGGDNEARAQFAVRRQGHPRYDSPPPLMGP